MLLKAGLSRALVFCCAVELLAAAPTVFSQSAPPAGVPPSVLRRLAQALWPEVLFDSLGRPVPGFRVRGFRGNPSSGFRVESVASDPVVGGLEIWRGSVVRCTDCQISSVAVVQDGPEFMTVLEAADLALPLESVLADGPVDAARVRRVGLGLLERTCILGCGVRVLTSPTDMKPDAFPRCHSLNGDRKIDIRPPRVGRNGSFDTYTLDVAAGRAIYRIELRWVAEPQRTFGVDAQEIADCRLYP